MKLTTQCNHCEKNLTAGEIIERWCDDCRRDTKTVERKARKEAA